MLRPEVNRDIDLPAFGLRMVPCEPGIQVAHPGGRVVPWWPSQERTAEEWSRYSKRDAATHLRVDAELKRLARYLHLERTFAWDVALEARIDSLTPAEVQAALGRHLALERLAVAKAGDFR